MLQTIRKNKAALIFGIFTSVLILGITYFIMFMIAFGNPSPEGKQFLELGAQIFHWHSIVCIFITCYLTGLILIET